VGKLQNNFDAWTEKQGSKYTNSAFNKAYSSVHANTMDVYNVSSNAVVLALSQAWIGIGMRKPAKTDANDEQLTAPKLPNFKQQSYQQYGTHIEDKFNNTLTLN
jgi:hypothetical protein